VDALLVNVRVLLVVLERDRKLTLLAKTCGSASIPLVVFSHRIYRGDHLDTFGTESPTNADLINPRTQ
jgi:hypothetical protein